MKESLSIISLIARIKKIEIKIKDTKTLRKTLIKVLKKLYNKNKP